MRNFSFLSFQNPFSRKNSYKQKTTQQGPKLQSYPLRTMSSSTSFNQYNNSRRFHPNVQEMKRVFEKYDTNNDGKISLPEYKAALRVIDDVAARRMFEVADKDGDGYIDFDEFLGVNTTGGGIRMADIRAAFRVFDLDGDGRISAEEVAEVLKRIGGFDGCGVDACKRMVKGVDKDGDGLVDMDEFVTMMTRTMKLVYN